MIPVPPSLNNSVINPPHLSSVCQDSFISSQKNPCDNRCFSCKDSNSKSNELSSPIISVPPSLNYSFINPPQLWLVTQQSPIFSNKETQELQASSIPGQNSPDPSNTMPHPSTNNGSRNIYRCMLDVSKLKPEQRQQHAIMLLHHYHELCNTNEPILFFLISTSYSQHWIIFSIHHIITW